jgi:hypothetical protein
MKKWISFALATVLCAGAVSVCSACDKDLPDGQVLTAETMVAEDAKFVKWEGRYDYTQGENSTPSMINLYHTASGFTVDFVGTSLSVEFNAEIAGDSQSHYPYYNVAVDDEVIPTLAPERTFFLSGGLQTVEIVKGLPYGEHTVKCLKMSEPYDAVTSVVTMETDGEFIKRDAEYDAGNFKFMVVCASGGSGHGSLAYSDDGKGSCGRTTRNSSSLHAFNYLTARMFGADVQFVANSGWGVSYPAGRSIYDALDYSGITTSNNVSGAKETAVWDYQKWTPDVILFNIGGNDTTSDGFKQTTYQKEVVEMVKKLHETYPNAYMIWTHTNSNAGNYAQSAMSDAGILQEDYMQIVIIPKVGADGTTGGNSHNSIVTHITTADILAKALTEKWGFTKLYDNILFEDYQGILQNF